MKFKAHFHSKMSVCIDCRHELGGSPPPQPPTLSTLPRPSQQTWTVSLPYAATIYTHRRYLLQESLANANVSARPQCVYEGPWRRNPQRINARNIMLKVHSMVYNSVAIFIRLAIVASHICEIQRSSPKILQQFMVIQGHRSWCQSKAHMRLPISD